MVRVRVRTSARSPPLFCAVLRYPGRPVTPASSKGRGARPLHSLRRTWCGYCCDRDTDLGRATTEQPNISEHHHHHHHHVYVWLILRRQVAGVWSSSSASCRRHRPAAAAAAAAL